MSLTMNRRGVLLFPAALGISAVVHLLLLFLWPYSPARPAQQPPEPIPVRLVQAPRPAPQPAPQPAAAPRRQTAPPETRSLAPKQTPPPESQPVAPQVEPEPQPTAPQAPLELAPQAAAPVPSSDGVPAGAAAPEPAAAGPPAAPSAGEANAQAAQVAAIQAVLSSLDARIAKKMRYPPLARAKGWQGKVLLTLILDGEGRLQSLAVRRSSGYAVLDHSAEALLREATPVPNPLGRPLPFEYSITYQLK